MKRNFVVLKSFFALSLIEWRVRSEYQEVMTGECGKLESQ
jgi:hypothetical protein